MKKAFVLLAGLATAMISHTPAAFANSPNWNATAQPIPSNFSQFDAAPLPASDPLLPTPAPNPALSPAPYVDAQSAGAQSAPIPEDSSGTADLGVQFDLSNQNPWSPQPSYSEPPVYSEPSAVTAPPLIQTEPLPDVNPEPRQPKSSAADFTLRDLFSGDTNSLAAVAVGNAEGTRTPEGKPSAGYYGHSDPGNGVWNLGTFSYQHGADSPEEADKKQLNRLKRQAETMQEKATAHGLKLTLEETLNGIDLANQAPKAVLDMEGYIEWLAKAHAMGLNGSDAILWARVQSFIDPKTQRWNAPGLGNNPAQITRDQQRRIQAIASAIRAQNYQISADARLKPQPIGFRFPKMLGMVRQLAQTAMGWLGA